MTAAMVTSAALPAQRDLRPRDAHRRSGDEGGHGAPRAAPGRRRVKPESTPWWAPSKATSTTSARTSSPRCGRARTSRSWTSARTSGLPASPRPRGARAHIVGLSALLTTTMVGMRDIVSATAAGRADPGNHRRRADRSAREIGADASLRMRPPAVAAAQPAPGLDVSAAWPVRPRELPGTATSRSTGRWVGGPLAPCRRAPPPTSPYRLFGQPPRPGRQPGADPAPGRQNPTGWQPPTSSSWRSTRTSILTSVGWANEYYQEAATTYTDEWGVGWRSTALRDPVSGRAGTPRWSCTRWRTTGPSTRSVPPDPAPPRALRGRRPGSSATSADEYWVVGVTVTTIWETAWALRGYAQLLMDFMADPSLADAILEIPYRYHLSRRRAPGPTMGVDMLWTGDDIGDADGDALLPRHVAPVPEAADGRAHRPGEGDRPRSALRRLPHGRGPSARSSPSSSRSAWTSSNPVQPACMDPAALARRVRRPTPLLGHASTSSGRSRSGRPTTCGPRCSTRLRTVGRDGGLILGPTHHVQLDTPMENFWLMVETIRGGPLPAAPRDLGREAVAGMRRHGGGLRAATELS